MRTKKVRYTGLIPAAGRATRLQNLTCSKEIYPLHFRDKDGQDYDFPVCKCLIDSYRIADVNDIYMIIRDGKEDIRQKLGNGSQYGVEITYLYTRKYYGPPYTLDEAYPLIQDQYVVLGFPDILFKPRYVFKQLIEKQQQTSADVVLGLFRAPNPQKMDMVSFDQTGKIEWIDIKPQQTSLVWTWTLAVWNPGFSDFMHQSLQGMLSDFESDKRTECHVGTIFQFALEKDIKFDHVFFNEGDLIDIGTPDDMRRIDQTYTKWLE